MNTFDLPGLVGSNSLGALAAFGLLRSVARVDPSAQLSWFMQDDWLARLHSAHFTSIEELMLWLQDQLNADAQVLTAWTDGDIRMHPSEFRSHQRACLASVDQSKFLAAVAADGVVDNQKGLIKPSAFYMVSGQQSFLGGLREISAALKRAKTLALWHEALMGPWSYATPAHSLGWDPASERLHALRHKAPTGEKASCVAAAVWLAALALPMFPCFASNGREATVGFTRVKRVRALRWPISDSPVDIETMALLLGGGYIGGKGSLRSGIAAVFESQRSEFGQGYAVFRPAQPVKSAGSEQQSS